MFEARVSTFSTLLSGPKVSKHSSSPSFTKATLFPSGAGRGKDSLRSTVDVIRTLSFSALSGERGRGIAKSGSFEPSFFSSF